MKVEKKVVGKEDLVVEVSSAEFMELLASATHEFMDTIEGAGGKETQSTIFLSLTVFSSMLLKKLFKKDEEEK